MSLEELFDCLCLCLEEAEGAVDLRLLAENDLGQVLSVEQVVGLGCYFFDPLGRLLGVIDGHEGRPEAASLLWEEVRQCDLCLWADIVDSLSQRFIVLLWQLHEEELAGELALEISDLAVAHVVVVEQRLGQLLAELGG